MKLQVVNAPKFGEGILQLLINGLMVSVFCPGSEAEQSINKILKSRRKKLKITILPTHGDITITLKSDGGSHDVPVKVSKNVFSLHINDLPINIFKKGSPVHMTMEVLFPNAKY